MLVVFSADVFPPDRGDKRRVHGIVKELSRRHQVVLAVPRSAYPDRVDVEAEVYHLAPRGGLRQLIDPILVARLRKLITSFKPDVIQLEGSWLAPHLLLGGGRSRGSWVVQDAIDVLRDRAPVSRKFTWPYLVAAEAFMLRYADGVLAVSERDADRLIELGASRAKVQVVSNGFDSEEFRPDLLARERKRRELGVDSGRLLALFFGTLSYPPNMRGWVNLRDEVLPRLERAGANFRLLLAGEGSENVVPGRSSEYVHALGVVPSLSEVINAADVVVAPLGRGGGSRLKIIESIACGTPVVANTWAAEGSRADLCGDYLTVTDDWDEFAAAVLRHTPGSLPRETPEAFAGYYEWKNIVSSIRYPEPAR